MAIRSAIPDIRCDDIDATRAFYTDLVGFDAAMESGNLLLFTSPIDPNVQDDKPWGIRRFSLLDPGGSRVTVLAHT